MQPNLFFCLILLLSFNSCQSQSTHDCPFPYRAHTADDRCGFLEVPLNRSNPQSQKTRIAYLVIKAKGKSPQADPVIFLQGGPGGVVLPLADVYSQLSIDNNRDFILFDQRGTGFSDPIGSNLSESLLHTFSQDMTAAEEAIAMRDLFRACKEEMQQTTKTYSNYNSLESVADIEDLRKHLGYSQWNLYGGSYGTRLALIYMELYPSVVRSATLTGIFPPQVRMYDHIVTNFDRSLDKVFESCAADPDCKQKYPDLQEHFFSAYEDLQTKPLVYEWNKQSFSLNSQDLLLFLHQMLYDRRTIAGIPSFIMAIKNGETKPLSRATTLLNQRMQLVNLAVYWSVMSGDEGAFDNAAKYAADLRQNAVYTPGVGLFLSDPTVLQDAAENHGKFTDLTTVQSDIPSLLISGGFDPVTPPSNADIAAQTLSQSYSIIFEKEGHAPFNPCFFQLAAEFINNPSKRPNDACAQQAQKIRWQ